MRYILLGMLAGAVISGMVNAKPSVGPQCFNKDEVMKYIDDNKFQTLLQSITPDGQTLEVLFTPLNDQETIIIQYGTGKYCLMSKTNKTKINDSSIDLLHEKLEKFRGTRS